MKEHGVILFHTTSSVMRTEKTLLKAGCVIKLVPTPREFSSDCGIAIRFEWDQSERIQTILTANTIDFEAIYRLESKSG
jgi:hypothetical protein